MIAPVTETWLLTRAQAAAALQVSLATLERRYTDGTIPKEILRRIGRRLLFHPTLLREWIDDGCPDARARRKQA